MDLVPAPVNRPDNGRRVRRSQRHYHRGLHDPDLRTIGLDDVPAAGDVETDIRDYGGEVSAKGRGEAIRKENH